MIMLTKKSSDVFILFFIRNFFDIPRISFIQIQNLPYLWVETTITITVFIHRVTYFIKKQFQCPIHKLFESHKSNEISLSISQYNYSKSLLYFKQRKKKLEDLHKCKQQPLKLCRSHIYIFCVMCQLRIRFLRFFVDSIHTYI